MNTPMRSFGFTLIELMITIAIVAILALLAFPMYGDFIANAQIRNATESVFNGLRLAQAEAIKRNAAVKFTLDPTTATGGWQVVDVDSNWESTYVGDTATIQTYAFDQGASKATFTPTPGASTAVIFNGFGRIQLTDPSNGDAAYTPLTQVDVTTAMIGTPHPLRVVIGLAGANGAANLKLCDPAAAATEPQACP